MHSPRHANPYCRPPGGAIACSLRLLPPLTLSPARQSRFRAGARLAPRERAIHGPHLPRGALQTLARGALAPAGCLIQAQQTSRPTNPYCRPPGGAIACSLRLLPPLTLSPARQSRFRAGARLAPRERAIHGPHLPRGALQTLARGALAPAGCLIQAQQTSRPTNPYCRPPGGPDLAGGVGVQAA